MTSSSTGKRKRKPLRAKNTESTKPFSLEYLTLDQRFFISPINAQVVSVESASDEEFDTFIRQYVKIGWTLEERVNALIDALDAGAKIVFHDENKAEDKVEEKLGESQDKSADATQFFTVDEQASEADVQKNSEPLIVEQNETVSAPKTDETESKAEEKNLVLNK